MAGASSAVPSAAAASAILVLLRGVAGEEESVQATPVATSISVMLLGSIGFQMLMFYLVNFPDRNIRCYSWGVISKTISIFCSVLLFQGFNGMAEQYIVAGGGAIWEVCVDLMQLVFWLTTLQVVLAVTSGAVNELWGADPPTMEKAELRVESWARLFAHVAGFAAINAWGSLQQKAFNGSATASLLVVPIGWLGLFIMYQGFDIVREHVSRMDDGRKDAHEHLWDETAEEAEHDVAGLSLSFLTVQAVRFYISGTLPNQEGQEEWALSTSHTSHECKVLLGTGLVFFVLSLLPLLVEARMQRRIESLSENTQELVTRLTQVWNNYFTFANAWCLFYSVKWALYSYNLSGEDSLLSVLLALILSGIGFFLVFILDAAEDRKLFGEDSEVAESAAEKFIGAMAVLIGFSWEQSFDNAVAVIAVSNKDHFPPVVSKLMLSVCLVLIVFPAWRCYILRTERELLQEEVDEGRYILKTASEQHRNMFLSKEVDEHALDLAHLRMKSHRRAAFGRGPTPTQWASANNLKHLRVTSHGIVEVEEPAEPRKKRNTHRQEITESLLG